MMHTSSQSLYCLLKRVALVGAVTALATGTLSAVDKPFVIDSSNLSLRPYCDNGIVYTPMADGYYAIGSGYLINSRVALTAAHVIYDTSALAWRTGSSFGQGFNNLFGYQDGTLLAGSTHLQSYSDALRASMTNPEYVEGKQDGPTFNSDVATVYAVQDISYTYGSFLVSRRGEPSPAAEQWSAMLLGYPVNDKYIPSSNAGFMHQTGPARWSMVDAYGRNNGSATLGAVNATMYICDAQMVAYGGNSGGPLFVFDPDEEEYVTVGQVLGGDDTDAKASTYFHVIDEMTVDLIAQAITAANPESNLIPATLGSSGSKTGITLGWNDSASNETSWQIRRNDGDGWRVIATAAGNTTAYTDTTAETGITYQYEVRAVQMVLGGVNKGAWSNRSSAARTGVVPNSALAEALGASYLYVTSEGDAPFHPSDDGTYIISGKVLNNQSSRLKITVTGPGALTCSTAASSEADCDLLNVTLDGTTVATLSGSADYTTRTLAIPTSGKHVVEFAYNKDPYATAGDDCITLKDIRYFGSSSTEAVQGGIVTSGGWRYSTWLGHYYDYGNHWIYAYTMGYVYVDPVTQSAWTSDSSQWVYFDQDSASSYPRIGWCWIGLNSLPYVWSVNQGWLYYWAGTNWFQKYSDKTWIKL